MSRFKSSNIFFQKISYLNCNNYKLFKLMCKGCELLLLVGSNYFFFLLLTKNLTKESRKIPTVPKLDNLSKTWVTRTQALIVSVCSVSK